MQRDYSQPETKGPRHDPGRLNSASPLCPGRPHTTPAAYQSGLATAPSLVVALAAIVASSSSAPCLAAATAPTQPAAAPLLGLEPWLVNLSFVCALVGSIVGTAYMIVRLVQAKRTAADIRTIPTMLGELSRELREKIDSVDSRNEERVRNVHKRVDRILTSIGQTAELRALEAEEQRRDEERLRAEVARAKQQGPRKNGQ